MQKHLLSMGDVDKLKFLSFSIVYDGQIIESFFSCKITQRNKKIKSKLCLIVQDNLLTRLIEFIEF